MHTAFMRRSGPGEGESFDAAEWLREKEEYITQMTMKRLILLVFAACLATQPLRAQSWADALQKALGGSAEQQTATKVAAPAAPPTARALRGSWTYRAPAMNYTGDDMLAALAVGTLRDQMVPLYARAGLEPGKGTVRFVDARRVVFELGTHRMEGTYTYFPATGALTVTLRHKERQAAFAGTASLSDGVLTLLFDAQQALEAIGGPAALDGVPQQTTQLEKLRQVAVLLEKYPGIRIGCQLGR